MPLFCCPQLGGGGHGLGEVKPVGWSDLNSILTFCFRLLNGSMVFARSLIKELCIIIPCTVTSVQLCDDLLLWDYALVLLELDDFFDIDREKYNDTGEYISKKTLEKDIK